jgi:hypothetical protein
MTLPRDLSGADLAKSLAVPWVQGHASALGEESLAE